MKKSLKVLSGAIVLAFASLFITSCNPTVTGDPVTPVVNPDSGGEVNPESGGKENPEQENVENQVIIDFSVYGDSENSKKMNEILTSLGDLTFDWTDAKFYKSGFAMRMYQGNSFTISSEKEISKVVLNFVSASYTGNNFSCNKDGFVLDGTTGTWEGKEKAITFSNGSTSNDQARITKITVTYKGAAATNGTGSSGGNSGESGGSSSGSGSGNSESEFPEDTRDLSAYNVLNIDFAEENSTMASYAGCNFKWEKNGGSNAPTANSNNGDVRLYKKNALTISSESEIVKIEIEFNPKNTGTFTCSPESFYTYKEKALWMGSAKSIKFTNTGSAAYIKKIIITYAGEKAPEILEAPEAVKNSDWLFVYYYDADNNLNDEIYSNMKEAEYSLSQLRNEDGSAKEGCPSINMVLLWDGCSKTDADYYKKELGQTIQYINSNGTLFELGADYDLEFRKYDDSPFKTGFVCNKSAKDSEVTDTNWKPYGTQFKTGSNTIKYKPNWLKTEPDMSDPDTLKNFLTWVNANYKAENVVICLSDHGAGTGKETYTNSTSSTRSHKQVSRTLCYDDSSSNTDRSLTCKNINDAFESAGYTGENKPKVIWMDVCLQATVEIANLLADKADYLLASPNLSVSHEYSHAFTNFKKDLTPEKFGKIMVSEYHHNMYNYTYPYDSSYATSGSSVLTQSYINLDSTKLNTLKTQIEALADVLIAYKAADSKGFESMCENYLVQAGNYEDLKGIAYAGTYSYLYDIGSLVEDLASDSTLTAAMPELENTANNVKTALSDVIVYSWGGVKGLIPDTSSADGKWKKLSDNYLYLTDGTDYLTGNTYTVDRPGNFYGLTIVTQSMTTGISDMMGSASSSKTDNMVTYYYTNTEYSEKWGEFLNALPDYMTSSGDDEPIDWDDPSIWDDDEDEGDN